MILHTSTRGCMRCARDLEPGRLLYCAACRASIDAPQPEEIARPVGSPSQVRVHFTRVIANDYCRRDVFPTVHHSGELYVPRSLAIAMLQDARTRAGVAYRAHAKRLEHALRTVVIGHVAAVSQPVPDSRQAEMFS